VTNHVSFSKLKPAVAANSVAGAPTSSTWRPSASTARAARTGLRTPRTAATAPAARVAPSMIEASSSTRPYSVSAAPRPALNSGSSSSTTTAASTASSAAPPAASTPWPASTAAAAPARIRSARSGSEINPPAPPWTTIAISSIATGA
jgi:hypothetical protein